MRHFSKTPLASRCTMLGGKYLGSAALGVDDSDNEVAERIEELLAKGWIKEHLPEAPVGTPDDAIVIDEVQPALEPDEVEAQLSGRAQAEELEELVASEPDETPEPSGEEEGDQGVELGSPAREDSSREEAEYDLTLLDQAVRALTADLEHIDDSDWLRALGVAEKADKNRKSALAAIDDAIEGLEG